MLCKYVKVAYWLMKNEVALTTRYESLIELCTDLDESNHLANWQKIRGKKYYIQVFSNLSGNGKNYWRVHRPQNSE